MILQPTVYMDQRDVTAWVDSVSVTQARGEVYRTFSVRLRGWHEVTPSSVFDVYATHDATNPRSTLLIRSGVIPPDRPPQIDVRGTEVLAVTVAGYDWVYLACVRLAPQTLVIAPDMESARRCVAASTQPRGKWSLLRATTVHEAVVQLGLVAGLAVELRIPDVAVAPQVLDPTKAIWDAIRSLVDPFAPDYYFRRAEDRVLIADRMGAAQGMGSSLVLSQQLVDQAKGITSLPAYLHGVPKYLRRVLIQVPPWL